MPATVIVLVVAVLWTGVTGDRANLGGDDSHLYFVDPRRFLSHVPLTTLDTNLAGFNPRIFMVPFLVLLAGIDALGLNVAGATLGIAAALTFTGVARLTMELLGGSNLRSRAGGLVAGTVVICAPILGQTQGTHLLLGIYWAPLLPWLVLFVLWHQRTGHLRWVFMTALAAAVGAPAINQLPWTIACLILMFAIGLVLLASGSWSPRPGRLALLLGLTIAVNGFWIVPVSQINRQGQSQLGTALSGQGREDALEVVRALIPLQRPLDTLSLRGSTRQFDLYQAPQQVPNRWPRRLWLLGLMPLGVILAATARTIKNRRQGSHTTIVLPLLLPVLLTFTFAMSPNLLPYGPELFEWMTVHIPGWTAMRNFFDKFAIPYAVAFATTCGAAFFVGTERLRRSMVGVATLVSVAGLVLYAAPAVRGEYFRLPYTLGASDNRVMSGLPRPYLRLLDELERRPAGPVLTLPLSRPAWSSFSKSGSSGVYLGISPIYWLTGRSDYNGVDSFTSPAVPELRSRVGNALTSGNIDDFAQVVSKLGIRYLVVNHQAPATRWQLSVSAFPDPEREAEATRSLVAALRAHSVGRFGDHELLEVAPGRRQEVVSLEPIAGLEADLLGRESGDAGQQSRICSGGSIIRTTHPSPTKYVVELSRLNGPCTLVLREAFSGGWQATLVDGGARTTIEVRKVRGFANGFDIKGGRSGMIRPVKVVITYEPQRLIRDGVLVSSAGTAALLGIAVTNRRRRSKSPVEPVVAVHE